MGDGAAEVGGDGTAMRGLLAVQLILGYEWLMSGLSKLLKGGFVSALGGDLVFRSAHVPGWYRFFLTAIVIPNARFFGAVVVIGELLLGSSLLAAAIIWATRWSRLSLAGRTVILSTVVVAGIVAIAMNVNYHIYTASGHPWLIAADPFGEGIDLDSLMPLLQAVLAVVALRRLFWLHRRDRASRRAAVPRPARP